jgi:hypothetical protein
LFASAEYRVQKLKPKAHTLYHIPSSRVYSRSHIKKINSCRRHSESPSTSTHTPDTSHKCHHLNAESSILSGTNIASSSQLKEKENKNSKLLRKKTQEDMVSPAGKKREGKHMSASIYILHSQFSISGLAIPLFRPQL